MLAEADKENLNDQIQRAPLFNENATEKETLEFSARPGKDPVHYGRQEEVARGKSMVTTVSRKAVDDRIHRHSNSEENNWDEANINQGRSASSLREYSVDLSISLSPSCAMKMVWIVWMYWSKGT